MSDKISFDGIEVDAETVRQKLAEHDAAAAAAADPRTLNASRMEYTGQDFDVLIGRPKISQYVMMAFVNEDDVPDNLSSIEHHQWIAWNCAIFTASEARELADMLVRAAAPAHTLDEQ